MNICLVNSPMGPQFAEMGHRVFSYTCHDAHTLDALEVVQKAGFTPHVLIQQENLGVKVLLHNLHRLDCIKVFWSIDSHLNYYWQWHYAWLFDVFFTPHPQYLQDSASFWALPSVHRLPVAATPRPFTPHAQRPHFINTVGRLSRDREQRYHVHNFLSHYYGTGIIDNISRDAMLDLYGQSRVVVNECIANETNFRLLEGAACGACVISPPIGEDQDSLFTPGQEILVYHDALELMHWLEYCKDRPDFTERLGHAAWQKAGSAHTAERRAAHVLACLPAAPHPRDPAQCRDRYLYAAGLLGIAHRAADPSLPALLGQIQDATLRHTLLLTRHIALKDRPGAQAAAGEARRHVQALLAQTQATLPPQALHDAASLAVLCGGSALYDAHVEESALCLDLYQACRGRAAEECPQDAEIPNEDALYALWMGVLYADGRRLLYGMHCSGYCQTSLDFVLMMLEKKPFSPIWARRILASPQLCLSNPPFAQAAAARLSMDEPSVENDLRYLVHCLRTFQVERAEGLLEEMLARLPQGKAKDSLKAVLLRQNPHLGLLRAWGA